MTAASSGLIARFAEFARPVLETPYIRKTRRNHGLEHATIHLLSGRVKNLQMAGRSDSGGFVLIGDAPTEQIEWAVHEALRRMRAGEHGLAVHPNCGTNLVTTGFLAATISSAAMAGASRRDVWNRLPLVTSLIMLVLVFGQPLGNSLQRHLTTEGDPGDLEIVSITRKEMTIPVSSGPVTVHRVNTRNG